MVESPSVSRVRNLSTRLRRNGGGGRAGRRLAAEKRVFERFHRARQTLGKFFSGTFCERHETADDGAAAVSSRTTRGRRRRCAHFRRERNTAERRSDRELGQRLGSMWSLAQIPRQLPGFHEIPPRTETSGLLEIVLREMVWEGMQSLNKFANAGTVRAPSRRA